MIEYVQYELKQRVNRDPPKPDNADAWMQSFARDIWNACIKPYRGFAVDLVPDASFLVGLQVQGANSLYKWERNTAWTIPKNTHTSIGIGIIQSEPLIAELQQFDLPAHQMLLFAIRAMLRVKQLVQGCGGKTEVILLLNEGLIMRPATRQIDNIENLAESMDRFLLEHGVAFVAGHVHTDDQSDLDELTKVLKRFKASYECLISFRGITRARLDFSYASTP